MVFIKIKIFLFRSMIYKIELAISYLNKEKYLIRAKDFTRIRISNQSFVHIISNCYYLKPIIFNYKNNYFEVHHG